MTQKPLNAREEAFVLAYAGQPLHAKSPQAAARIAGYADPTVASRRLLGKPAVREALMRRDQRHLQEVAAIDASWVLHELAQLWSTPITDLFEDDGTLRRLRDLSPQAQKLITSLVLTTGPDGETRITKLKVIDRLRVLENIGKTTAVNAYGTKEQADANAGLASVMRAREKLIGRSDNEIDITPKGDDHGRQDD